MHLLPGYLRLRGSTSESPSPQGRRPQRQPARPGGSVSWEYPPLGGCARRWPSIETGRPQAPAGGVPQYKLRPAESFLPAGRFPLWVILFHPEINATIVVKLCFARNIAKGANRHQRLFPVFCSDILWLCCLEPCRADISQGARGGTS